METIVREFINNVKLYWPEEKNPHKPQSAVYDMWNAAYGAKTRPEFLKRAGVKGTHRGHASKYFDELYRRGYIMFLVDQKKNAKLIRQAP